MTRVIKSSIKKVSTKLSKSVGKCNIESANYGKCIKSKLPKIELKMCEIEMKQFMKCIKLNYNK